MAAIIIIAPIKTSISFPQIKTELMRNFNGMFWVNFFFKTAMALGKKQSYLTHMYSNNLNFDIRIRKKCSSGGCYHN